MSSGLRRCIGLRRWCGMAVSDFFYGRKNAFLFVIPAGDAFFLSFPQGTPFFLSFPEGICVFCCLFLLHINRKTAL